eukprot:scaffold395_cov243-Pinguiococcus_pyrenoidosus.AAC.18
MASRAGSSGIANGWPSKGVSQAVGACRRQRRRRKGRRRGAERSHWRPTATEEQPPANFGHSPDKEPNSAQKHQ